MKTIIVDAGESGLHIANHVALEQKDVDVIDTDPEGLRRVSDHIDIETLLGTGSSPIVLEGADLMDAEIVLSNRNRPGKPLMTSVTSCYQQPEL